MGFTFAKEPDVSVKAPSGPGKPKVKKIFGFTWPDGTSIEFVRDSLGMSMKCFSPDGQLVLQTDTMEHKYVADMMKTLE